MMQLRPKVEGKMLNLIVNGSKQQFNDHVAFEAFLASLLHTDDLEISVSFNEAASMFALLNQRCGWLMFLRFPEDTGFSSRNPSPGMSAEGTETFILGNGQADLYPKSWTLDRATVFAAILSFGKTGEITLGLLWHADGGS
jgi:hypothetical protein